MTSRFKQQGRWLLALLGVFVAATAVINTLVNPLRMQPAAWSLAALDPYREIGDELRTGKAGLANYHRDVEGAVVGSSRLEIGLDPLQPAFKGAVVLNAAMAAGGLHESAAMARYLMERQPYLRRLIFGLDTGDLSSDTDSRTFTDFYESPLANSAGGWDHKLKHVVGVGALGDSFATLSCFVRRAHPSRTALGRWVTPRSPVDIRAHLTKNSGEIFRHQAVMSEIRPQSLREAKIAKLRELFGDLRQRGVEVWVTIPPQLAIKQLHPQTDVLETAPWSIERRGIYELCREVNAMEIPGGPPVQLWDFATFSETTCVPLPPASGEVRKVPHWFDMGHFDVTIGHKMIERMMGVTVPPAGQPLSEQFGVNVLQVGIEAHLDGLRQGHARYCREHSDDVTWARSILPVFKLQRNGVREGEE